MKKSFLSVLVTLFLVTLFSGCNTSEGVGKDVEKAGESIQEAAEDAGESIKKTAEKAGENIQEAAEKDK